MSRIATSAHRAQINHLRAQADEIDRAISDMTDMYVTIGQRTEWADPRLDQLDADIAAAEATVKSLYTRMRLLRATEHTGRVA